MNSGDVRTSWRLQLADRIFKDAAGPITVGDLSEFSRPSRAAYQALRAEGIVFPVSAQKLSEDRPLLVNPGQCICELRDNPGYVIGGGQEFGRFPDGTFRYWYKAAPGWAARWIVTEGGKVIARHGAAPDPERSPAAAAPEEQMYCQNPECKKPLARGREKPLPWCDEQCREAWRRLVLFQPAEKPAQ